MAWSAGQENRDAVWPTGQGEAAAGSLPGPLFAAWARLAQLRRLITGLTGWRRAATAVGAGALSVFAMAPFFFSPILIVSFTVLVWLLDGARARPLGQAMRRGAWTVWLFSFGFLFPGLAWIGEAFLVDAQTFAWLMPFAITILPAGLAFFLTALMAPAMVLWRPGAVSRVLLVAALWLLAEWLRGHLFTGFPWNLVALSWIGTLPVAQSAAWLGSYGLSGLTVAWAASFACLGDGVASARDLRRRLAVPAGLTAVFAGLFLAGSLRIAGAGADTVSDVTLRLVQPNTPQQERMIRANRDVIWQRLIDLTDGAADAGVTHVIWPEGAPPGLLARNRAWLSQVAQALGPDAVLLAGSLRAEPAEKAGQYRFYNGFLVVDADGQVLSSYDKRHLVPFGEYVPWAETLNRIGIQKVAQEVGGMSFGDGARRLSVPGAPLAAPVICYEIIFPGQVIDAGQRPEWIVNVTDDSWFGNSIGPRQHFSIARMRAIEEGLPVVRAANGGISAVIDGVGRVRAKLALHERGFLDAALPVAQPRTGYGRWRDTPALALALMCVIALMILKRRPD